MGSKKKKLAIQASKQRSVPNLIKIEEPAAVLALDRDIIKAGLTLSRREVQFLVDAYYRMQEYRISANNQQGALEKLGEPNDVLKWYFAQSILLEKQLKKVLDSYSSSVELGVWARKTKGIGEVLAAGLLAHIDITKAPTVGHIWRFAGLDPTSTWEKKQKRPWNASLKVLCWKIGESFVKVSGKEDAYYGQIYKQRKAYEIANNEAGKYAGQAEEAMKRKNYGKDTDAYKAYIKGRLPPARIQRRSARYAVKLFLSHYHHQAYVLEYGKEPPLPYPIAHLGHVHYLAPPK